MKGTLNIVHFSDLEKLLMAIKPTYEELEQRIKELESCLEQRKETLRLVVERNR